MQLKIPQDLFFQQHNYEIIQLPEQLFLSWFDGTQPRQFDLLRMVRKWLLEKYPTALHVGYDIIYGAKPGFYKMQEGLYLKLRDLTDDEIKLYRLGVLKMTPLWNNPQESILELQLSFDSIY